MNKNKKAKTELMKTVKELQGKMNLQKLMLVLLTVLQIFQLFFLIKQEFQPTASLIFHKTQINDINYKIDELYKEQAELKIQIVKQYIDHLKHKLFKLNAKTSQYSYRKFESVLIKKVDFQILKKWIPQQVQKFKLIHRGSRDGIGAEAFHNHCDDKGATVTIMKSNYGALFGGFAITNWTRTGGWVGDNLGQSFMFSLTHQKKFPINEDKKNNFAKYHHQDYGPKFDHGTFKKDFKQIQIDLGYNYNCSEIGTPGTQFTQSYLGGAVNFDILEIEVFQVILEKQ